MLPTFLSLVGFFATLGISERFATPRTAASDSLATLQEDFAADSLESIQDTFPSVASKPLPLVQLATRSAVAPTSCASYACRVEY
jgi:hypothetical protein